MSEQWQVSGTYFEACNCETVCPCNLLGAPTEGDCKVVVAWHVEKGQYEGTKLDGLNAALFAFAPGHMMESKWQVALYTDDKADAQQAQALAAIFSGQGGGHLAALGPLIGEVLGVKPAQIEYQADGNTRHLRIGNVADVEIEGMSGQGGRPVEVRNVPFTVVPDVPMVLSKSKRLQYEDYGFSMDINDRNGYYSPFTYQA